MRGLTNFLGRFTTIAAVAGVVSYFWKFDSYLTVLYCCAGLCFLHSVLNVAFGDLVYLLWRTGFYCFCFTLFFKIYYQD